ncbi:MAG: glycosyltransferase family 2 protein [Candidatus Helarchaeota archaeon]
MKFSVIIPTTFKRDTILYALKSLKKQTFKDFEIIISTNNDKTDSIYQNMQIKNLNILYLKESGLSFAKNEGIKVAKGEIISIIDDDIIPSRNWLKNLSMSFMNKKIGIASGPILPIWPIGGLEVIRKSSLAKEWLSLIDVSDKKILIDRVFGCNFSARKKIFREFGLFKTYLGRKSGKLLGGEDTEFCSRVNDKYSILYNPKIKVYHVIEPKRMAFKWIYKRAYYGGYSKALQKKIPKRIGQNNKYSLFDFTLLIPYFIGYSKGSLEVL